MIHQIEQIYAALFYLFTILYFNNYYGIKKLNWKILILDKQNIKKNSQNKWIPHWLLQFFFPLIVLSDFVMFLLYYSFNFSWLLPQWYNLCWTFIDSDSGTMFDVSMCQQVVGVCFENMPGTDGSAATWLCIGATTTRLLSISQL